MNHLSLASIWLLLGAAVGQAFNMTIDASTCVAPSEYNTCWATTVAAEATCMKNADGNDAAINGCGCGAFVEQMNCFASACWNRIYGCEYQSLVANYFELCLIASTPVPYWPAPDNAPGSCSCNTGKVLENYLAAELHTAACLNNATSMESLDNFAYVGEMDTACSCCATGITISGIYDICPDTDPTLIGLNQILSAVSPLQPWPSCGPSLQQFNCVNDLQFAAPEGTGSVYNPTNLPASGTQTLSNIAGEVTSPASGSVFSYSNVGTEWTVTALSIGAKQATTTEKSAGSAAATQGGSGSTAGGSSATGSAASGGAASSATPSTKKSGADKMGLNNLSVLAVVAFGATIATL